MTEADARSRPRLDGLFIVPGDNLHWSRTRWRDALEAIAAAGINTVILQWCAASGRALYPSGLYAPMPGMALSDLVQVILSAAKRARLSVILGLDATRRLGAIHYAPVESPAQRLAQMLQEVLSRYGDADALAGFYLPQEWSAPLIEHEAELLVQCATLCRRLGRGLPVCTTAPQPKLPVTGRKWELSDTDPEALACQRELISRWAVTWGETAIRGGLNALLLRDDLGSRRCALEATSQAYRALSLACSSIGCEVWGQIGLYEVAHRRDDFDPPRLHSAGLERLRRQLSAAAPHCQKLVGFSLDYVDPALGGERLRLYRAYRAGVGVRSPSTNITRRERPRGDIPSPLLEKAQALERNIDERHMLEGQIMTVVDYRYDVTHPRNQWQEDADWLTGLYAGAESLRFAATGDRDACARARRSFEALCMLSTVSGVPGVVARCFRRQPVARLGAGRKRWVKVQGHHLWWATDISRDQLSGHFFGLAAYYDLVADNSERRLIRRLVSDIAGSILDHRMQAVDWDGEYTTHGNFWVAPFQALAVLKIAYHITRQPRFQQAYLHYINPHFFLGHAQIQAAHVLDPFYQHYQWDSPAYHLLQYETQPDILYHLLRALDLVYTDVKDSGNVYLYFVYQTYRPESDAARRGEAELLQFDPQRQYRMNYRRYLEKILRQRGDELPPRLRDTLRYYLEPGKAPRAHLASFIPMSLRPPMEFNWQYYPGIQTRGRSGGWSPGGDHAGYAGVDYLLAYWMGRYHGFLR